MFHQGARLQIADYKAKIEPSKIVFYSEKTICPGATPVEKGEPEMAVGVPVEGLYL